MKSKRVLRGCLRVSLLPLALLHFPTQLLAHALQILWLHSPPTEYDLICLIHLRNWLFFPGPHSLRKAYLLATPTPAVRIIAAWVAMKAIVKMIATLSLHQLPLLQIYSLWLNSFIKSAFAPTRGNLFSFLFSHFFQFCFTSLTFFTWLPPHLLYLP